MTFGCVLLTMGRRPDDLRRALDSLLRPARRRARHRRGRQRRGSRPGCPTGVRGVGSAENVGIPAGRNLGVPARRSGELLFFLDDDASAGLARRARARSRGGSRRTRRWGCCSCASPRATAAPPRATGCRGCGSGDRARSSDITAVWEGAVAMRRAVFERGRRLAGGLPVRARGDRPRVARDGRRPPRRLRRRHRRAAPVADRHAARLLLLLRGAQPGLAGPPPPPARRSRSLYVAASCCARCRACARAQDAREALRGYRDGLRGAGGERRPLQARTLWRMTRAGRPPIM